MWQGPNGHNGARVRGVRVRVASPSVTEPWRVLALAPLPVDVLQRLFGVEGAELVVPPERTQQAVEALLPTADIVIGDWSRGLRVHEPGRRVAFVQVPSVGVDTVDTDACARAGVPVANAAGANTTSVAEWCVAATLALLRRTVEADAAVRRGEWPQTTLGGRELAGSRVGVVGMGPIGRAVATMFTALGCTVDYWSRSRHDDAPAEYVELDQLLAGSDVVVLVIALGPTTRHLLDARRLALMQPSALLVNGARGDVVDEAALMDVLREGRLAGAALDVFRTEPMPPGSPLRDLPGVLLSPHLGGSTDQAARRLVAQARANLLRALSGEPVVDVVNGVDPHVSRR